MFAAWVRKAAFLLALGAGLGRAVGAEASASPTPGAPAPVTSVGEFWAFAGGALREPQPLRMELIVYYYDASWSLLYGEVDGIPSYFPVHGKALPLKSGQKVRLEGTVIPAEGFDGTRVKATVLAEGLLPEPLRTAGRLEDFAALHGRWTEMEGYVLSQQEPDATHVEAKLLSDSRVINLTLQISGTDPVPQLTGARVRVLGAYDAVADATGRPGQIQCWSSERVQVLGWLADDPRFKLPATPVDRLADAAGQPWVRLAGEAWAQEPGHTLTLRDGSGQVTIATPQPEVLPAHAAVEVIGRPVEHDLVWTLADPIFRRSGGAAAARGTPVPGPGQAPLRLRLAEQVLHLAPEDADKHQAVTLRGVVTWFDERGSVFYLQDVSGGVRVRRPPGRDPALVPGASIAVTGATVRGVFVPEVELSEVRLVGAMGMPAARLVSLDQALAGTEECRRIELRGYVRQVRGEGPWTRLDVTAPTGEFAAYLPAGDAFDYLQGAMVRLRGVCAAVTDAKREISGVQLWVQDRDAVMVDEPPPRDPFALPAQTTAGLRQFSAARTTNGLVRLAGMVGLQDPGRSLYLQDAQGGLLVLSRSTTPVRPGTWVEVVGLPGRAGNRAALREGVWRIVPRPGPEIQPREVTAAQLPDPALDLQLVRVHALVRQAGHEDGRARLTLEADGTIFEGLLAAAKEWTPPAPGSRVELTGVVVVEFDDYRQPRGFRLELRGPADVAVLATPSWWTPARVLAAGGLLAAAVLAALGWVVALRRRVRQQTEQLRMQLEKEAKLQTEIERATRLESLGVLAGGIAHDFNNLLTAILGNLGLAAMDKRVMAAAGDCIAEAERGARRARDITHQLLTFAKGGEPVRAAVALPEVVTEAANFARHGHNVKLDIEFPPDLPAGDVDAGQISRVVHNLVVNAAQAMPDGGMIGLRLAAVDLRAGEVAALPPARYLRLTVSDTGAGIPPEVLPRIFDPYFSTKDKRNNSGLGLATVRSIVRKHGGEIAVESTVGKGTTFRVWLPVAREEPAALPAPTRSSVPRHARILVMDDEAVIRRVAARMLALAGHETVFAVDGSEAVRAYTAARQSGRPFDLAIFDLSVPGGMGGREALAELRRLDPSIRAIASSGYSDDPVLANPKAHGFLTALPKPYDIPDLLRAIEEVLRP